MINFNDYIDIDYTMENGDTFEWFEEEVITLINQSEVIYYSDAMKFLAKHDPSLQYSLELVQCVSVSAINSEMLATALLRNMLHSAMPDLQELWDEEHPEEE